MVRFEKFLHKQGSIFEMIVFSTTNPTLSPKLNVLSHYSVISSQIWKFLLSQTGVIFGHNHFEYQQPYIIFQHWTFSPLVHYKWSDLKNSFTNRGQFLRQSVWVPTTYATFKIEHFIPYFCLSQYYLLYVYIRHIFYFSSAILKALNDNLEHTVFM